MFKKMKKIFVQILLYTSVLCLPDAWSAPLQNQAPTCLNPPVPHSQEVQIVQGSLYQYLLEIHDANGLHDRVSFSLKKAPTGMRLLPAGKRGCCIWRGLITWLPGQTEVGKSQDVTIEINDLGQKTAEISYKIKVLEKNEPPSFSSQPVTQIIQEQAYRYQVKVSDPDSTKQVVSFRLLGAPKGMTISQQGLIEWTPQAEDVGLHGISVEAFDPLNAKNVQSFLLEVKNKDDKPVIHSLPLKGATIQFPYLYHIRASDPDPNSTLTYKLIKGHKDMRLHPTLGVLRWIPKQSGTVSVEVHVIDQTGLFSVQKWSVRVVAKNIPPQLLTVPPESIKQNDTFSYLLKAKDADGDAIQAVVTHGPKGMRVQSAPAGRKDQALLSWKPTPTDVGIHHVRIRVDDGKGGLVWQDFKLSVSDINDAPVIVSQAPTKILQGSWYRYWVKASDADAGDRILYALYRGPKGMHIDPVSGLLMWLPGTDSVGKHTIEVVAEDTRKGKTIQRYTLEVLDKNDPPVFTSSPVTTAIEGRKYLYEVKAKDPEVLGQIRFRLSQKSKGMNIDPNTGIFTWTPNNEDVGHHQVVIEVFDNQGGVSKQSFSIEVKNTNSPPMILSKPPKGATVGRQFFYQVIAKDPDKGSNQQLFYSLRSAPSGMKIVQQTGLITWTPQKSDLGKENDVLVQVSDTLNELTLQRFTLKVFEKNNPPRLLKQPPASISEGRLFTFTLGVADPDKDTLDFSLEKSPEGVLLDSKTGEIKWFPAPHQVGTHQLQIRVDDGKGGILILLFAIKVEDVNTPPVVDSYPLLLAVEGRPYVYRVRVSESDAADIPKLKWAFKGTPPKGCTLDSLTGQLRWTPTQQQVGRFHEIQLEISDGKHTVPHSVFVFVQEQNQAPKITSKPPVKVLQGDKYFYPVKHDDPDFGILHPSFRLLQSPEGMTIHPWTGVIKWLPKDADVGNHPVVVQVKDAKGAESTQSYTLKVEDRNDPPVFLSAPPKGAVAGETFTYAFSVKDGDQAQDPVTFQLLDLPPITTPSHQMKVDIVRRTLTWLPAQSDVGKSFLVTLQVQDSRKGLALQSFILTVYGKNRKPTWKTKPPATFALQQGKPFSLLLQATDPDGDQIRYRLRKAPEGMHIHSFSGRLSWTPEKATLQPLSVVVEVCDTRGGILNATLVFKVSVLNQPPKIVSNPKNQILQDDLFVYQVQIEDVDPKETFRYNFIQAPKGMSIDSNGKIQWRTSSSDVGFHTISIRVIDSANNTDTQRFTLQVIGRNTPPRITSQPIRQVVEGTIYRYQILAEDVDLPKQTLFYQLLSGPTGMSVDARTGLLRWNPTQQDVQKGQHTIRVQVRDEQSGQDEQTYQLSVINKNTPPRILSISCLKVVAGSRNNCVIKAEDTDPGLSHLTFELRQAPKGMKLSTPTLKASSKGTVATAFLEWTPRLTDVGEHIIELLVRDGSATQRNLFTISVTLNQDAPIADAGENRTIFPGEVLLDGSRSRDLYGGTLEYNWTLQQSPQNEKVMITNAKSMKPKMVLRVSGLYIFQLIVKNKTQESPPAVVRIEVKNVKPYAEIIAPYAGQVGQKILLNGANSGDANGDGLRYFWKLQDSPTLEKPVVFEDTSQPTFVPTKPGLYRIALVLQEKLGPNEQQRSESTFAEIVVNDPENKIFLPYAKILAPTTGTVDQGILLDGSRSRNLMPGSDDLRYEWVLLTKNKSAKIDSASSPVATLTANEPGYFLVGLVVRVAGGKYRSRQAVVGIRISGKNKNEVLPIASAASGYAVYGTKHTLNALLSRDPNGGQLSFRWEQIGGIPVTLQDARSARPSFFVLNHGNLRFRLWVRGNGPESAPHDILIRVHEPNNKPPIADAGDELIGKKALRAGSAASFSGRSSKDPEGKELLYRWRQMSGIPVTLLRETTVAPSFVPLSYGILTFSLEVFDGDAWSMPRLIRVAVHSEDNQIPFANAGKDQQVRLGQVVTLQGKGEDLDQDKLTYHWRLIEPSGVRVTLNEAEPDFPTFTPTNTEISKYVFGLRVDDGKSFSVEDIVEIKVLGTNRPPVSSIQPLSKVFVGDKVVLDGTSSYDPDGDKILFKWTQADGPRRVQLKVDKDGQASFVAPEKGVYRFLLQVEDGHAKSAPYERLVQVGERKEEDGCTCQTGAPTRTPDPFAFLLLFVVVFSLYRIRKYRGGLH